jgi:hypothetical protein
MFVLDQIEVANSALAAPLGRLLATASVFSRENTGHGFYTRFDVARALDRLDTDSRLLNGPNLDVDVGGRVLMMGFILWLEDGFPLPPRISVCDPRKRSD